MFKGINNKIKVIKRQAYGFTNFDHLRMRLLIVFSYELYLSVAFPESQFFMLDPPEIYIEPIDLKFRQNLSLYFMY